MRAKKTLVAGLLLTLALLQFGCGGSSDTAEGDDGRETIKVGYSGDFSGLLAPYDTPFRNGVEFAVDEINNSDSKYGVEVEILDNKSDAQLTVSQTQELLDSGAMLNLIGTGEGRTAAARVVSEAGGIAFAAINTYPTFTAEAGPNSALLSPGDNVQAAAAAKYACEQGYKTAYTFSSQDFAYTKGLPVYFGEAFQEECGGEVVGNGEYSLGQTDYAAIITPLKQQNPQPDVIYSPMFVPDLVAFTKQLRQAGIETPYIGPDAIYLKDFIASAGQAAEGVMGSPYAFASPGSALKKFQTQFTKATGAAPVTPLYEAMGRDNIYGIVKAAELAGSTDPEAILAELSNLPDETFVAMDEPTIDPDAHYVTSASIPIVEIQNGEYELKETIKPGFVPEPTR